jgi:hypothetical protein
MRFFLAVAVSIYLVVFIVMGLFMEWIFLAVAVSIYLVVFIVMGLFMEWRVKK